MQVSESVTSCAAISALLVVLCGMLLDGAGRQDSVFSEAQAYERFMGRWSRGLALHFVRFAGVREKLAVPRVHGRNVGVVSTGLEDREELVVRQNRPSGHGLQHAVDADAGLQTRRQVEVGPLVFPQVMEQLVDPGHRQS